MFQQLEHKMFAGEKFAYHDGLSHSPFAHREVSVTSLCFKARFDPGPQKRQQPGLHLATDESSQASQLSAGASGTQDLLKNCSKRV